jgi:hypothetical protein
MKTEDMHINCITDIATSGAAGRADVAARAGIAAAVREARQT